jgi:predicted nucleic acid-binding protein
MIYLDTSVVLAWLIAEDRVAPAALWRHTSRLLVYETWVRLHALGLRASRGIEARAVLARIAFVELSPEVLTRALEPFPIRVRTLNALHLVGLEFLRARRQSVQVATYDSRMREAVEALGFESAL